MELFGDFPRYKFCKENEKHLAQFINVAKQNKSNQFCDLEQYKNLRTLLPRCNESIDSIIDITSDNEGDVQVKKEIFSQADAEDCEIENIAELNQTTFNDIIFSIKETLETEKCIPISVLSNLQMTNINLEDIFVKLSSALNQEEVINLGLSINSSIITNEMIVSYYLRHLWIKEIDVEYSEEIQRVGSNFIEKYQKISKDEIVQYLLYLECAPTKSFLQFLDACNVDFKAKLLKYFINSCNSFKQYHINILENLLNNQTDQDSLNKLVDLLSVAASNFSSDKNFGKLIINVIKRLGKNVNLFEQSLKHIIGYHKSIWKAKMQQIFQELMEDNFSITQSFRY